MLLAPYVVEMGNPPGDLMALRVVMAIVLLFGPQFSRLS